MSGQITPEILNLFPAFDGESMCLAEYLERFNRILSMFNLNRVKGLKILTLKVTGRAERAYHEIMRTGIVHDYQSLINELDKKLSTESSKIAAKYGLLIEMKAGEKLADFAERIRSNVMKGYSSFAETHRESLAADIFVKGISSNLRSKIMDKTYPTLNDALERAEAESLIGQLTAKTELEQKIDRLNQALVDANLEEKVQTQVNYMNGNYGNEQFGDYYDDDYQDDYGNHRGNYENSFQDDFDDYQYSDNNYSRPFFGNNYRPNYDNSYGDYHNYDNSYNDYQNYENSNIDYPNFDNFNGDCQNYENSYRDYENQVNSCIQDYGHSEEQYQNNDNANIQNNKGNSGQRQESSSAAAPTTLFDFVVPSDDDNGDFDYDFFDNDDIDEE